MNLSVPSELHHCSIGESFIFLSLRNDRYSLLQGRPAERFHRFLEGTASDHDIEWLAARRIIAERGTAPGTAIQPILSPQSSVIDAPLPAAKMGALVAAIWAQRQARRDIARKSLVDIFAEFAMGRRDTGPPQMQVNLMLASAFERARRYVSATDQCLVRGVAMRRLLLRHNQEARLVIGVAMPFSAHCWVQVGDAVLTDPLDFVRSFQPILAV